MKVEDIKDLKPIAENTLKTLYGEGIQNVKVVEARQYPILGEKAWWDVETEFDDGSLKYWVTLRVEMADGVVSRTEEKQRKRLVK